MTAAEAFRYGIVATRNLVIVRDDKAEARASTDVHFLAHFEQLLFRINTPLSQLRLLGRTRLRNLNHTANRHVRFFNRVQEKAFYCYRV